MNAYSTCNERVSSGTQLEGATVSIETRVTHHRSALRAALLASLTLLLVKIFEWNIVDWVTVFLIWFVVGAVWLAFIGVGTASFLHLARHWRDGYQSFLPLLVCEVVFGLVWFFPFTQTWLQGNFYWYKSAREEIVQRVHSGDLIPNVSYNPRLVALGSDESNVSMGGNDIVVEEHAGQRYILFFSFRGVLSNASGFLYVPEGGDPRQFGDVQRLYKGKLLFKIEEHWYFLGAC
jgi:hypothetical protein